MSSNDRTPADAAIHQALADVSREIQSILDTVEAEAAEIRAHAEREAERYLAERREAANRVVANQIKRLEQFSHELVTEVDRALSSAPDAEAPAKPPFIGSGLTEEFSALSPTRRENGTVNQNGSSASASPRGPVISREEALLRATQMAIAKKDRAEIEAALQSELGIEASRQIADDVLGAPSPRSF